MSSLRGQLRLLVHDALVAANTLAGDNVFLPRDWPTNSQVMPAIAIQTAREQKQNVVGRNGPPQFNTLTWLELRCQVSGPNEGQVEDDLETLADQAELVVMGLIISAPQRFQQIAQGEYEFDVDASGENHLGVAKLLYGFEYRERFDIVLTDPLKGIDLTVARGPSIRVVTSAATLSGAVLSFASLPDGIAQGQLVTNATTDGTLPAGTLVQSIDPVAMTVTMNKSAIGPGIALGDTIEFTGPVLATATFDVPTS